jgi:outer membrane protein OmpA-like peptidoglycan-associated protein
MGFCLMAFRVPRRPKLGFKQPFDRRGNVVALVVLSALFVSQAEAQAIRSSQGGGAAVTVDNSVLDQLGPSRTAKTPAKTPSSVHLIPPKSSLATATPTSSSKTSHQRATTGEPAVAALTPPAPEPTPKQPASSDAATPPSKPAVTATAPPPLASAPGITARAPVPPSTAVPPTTPAAGSPPVQMAAATTVGNPANTLAFKPGVTDLGSGDQPVIDAVANRLLANENFRVQLISHATGGADDAMEARRVSLARAVAVRAYLVAKGVPSQRIDVRALGNHVDSGPVADQLDLVVVSQ